MSTRAKRAAELLDPTALEQSGLDPQQIQKEIDAAVKQAVSQTTSSSATSSSTPPPSSVSSQPSPSSSAPSTPSYNTALDAVVPPSQSPPSPQKSNRPEPWKLDPTHLEQTGLDPQQVQKSINAAVKTQQQSSSPPPTSTSSTSAPGTGADANRKRPSILDIIYKLDPTTADQTSVDNFYSIMKNLQLAVWTSGGQPSAGDGSSSGSSRDYTKGRGLQGASGSSGGSSQSPGGTRIAPIPADYLLDQRNPENIVNRLSAAYDALKKELEQTVSKYGDVLQASGNGIAPSQKLQSLLDKYNKALDELKSLPDVEKALRDRFGSYVVVSGGSVDLAPGLKATLQKLGEFSSAYDSVMHDYKAAVDDIIKRYNLKRDEEGKLVVDPDKYEQVKAELEAVNKKYSEALGRLFSNYGDLFNKRVVDGKVVYELKPEVQAAVALQDQLKQTVAELAAAQQQTLQNVLSKYGDVLAYDPKTGKITPSRELEEMLNRYSQATQEVNKLAGAINTVAGMLPTFAQQLPVATVKFQTFDKSQGKFVETGGETPIYVKDEKMRKEIADWMSQNKDKVKVAAFYDPNKPVVYIYNDRDEGYIINPVTGEARRARGVSAMVDDTAKAMWYKSLTDKEKKELEQYYRLQWEKEQTKQTLESLPPVVRELYGALITAGQYAPISSSADIVIRAVLGQEDPLAGVKKIQTQAEAVKEASPTAYAVGTGIGLAGMVGLGAESILARGAAKLAAQGAKTAAEDITKFAIVKKPEFPVTGPIQYVQQTAKAPTLLQTALAGLRDAAVPMTMSGAAFGGLEAAKSYLETGKVDVPRVLEAAAFGSLMGAFPITKKQALAALGIGAGATAGASLIRGYDLTTSLAVGEAAGLTALVGGGAKSISEAGAKARAPEVKITDFATVVKPEWRAAPRVDLSGVDFAKRLSSAIENVVADVVSGRVSVEEANLRLGAIRDAVPDKALFDSILQSLKTVKEPPRAPTLDFATAAKKAAEVVKAAESDKMPGYRAFIELADIRASAADKARFDSLFGAKLREYGEQYVGWLLNSGLDKPSAALQLAKYEDVLGRQFIERYMPDYRKALAEVEGKLAQLRPVSPREAPAVRLTPEELYARVKSLFDDVVEGRKDFFKASEELYKMWRDVSPEVRGELEAVLNQLNRIYGEKYGLTLEPWKPSLLETALRKAELFAADVRAAVGSFLEGLRRRWERGQAARLYEEAIDTVNKFRRGEISLEEAKRRLLELAERAEKVDKELSETFRKRAEKLGRERAEEKPPQAEKKIETRRPPDDRDVEFVRRAEEEERRLRMEKERRESGSGRGQQQLLLLKEEPKALLDREVIRIVERFRRGELTAEEARRRILDAARRAEKFDKALAELYRSLADAVEKGDLQTMDRIASQLRDVASKTDVFEVQMYGGGQRPALEVRFKEGALVLVRPKTVTELKPETRVLESAGVRQVLRPEVRSALVEGLETRQRLRETDATLTAPMTAVAAATQLKKPTVLYAVTVKEFETPETRRRLIIPLLHTPTEIQQTEPPPIVTYPSNTPERTPQYESPLLTTTTPPSTYTVTTPTYTPVPPITVPKISEVPTVGIQPVPTPDTVPVPPPLPPGWWRLLPPDSVASGSEGAYRVQEGKKQILALA